VSARLEDHPLVAGLDPGWLATLSAFSRPIDFAPGTYLLREGEQATVVHLVSTGCVSLEVHQTGRAPRRLETIEGGSIVGLSWMFPPYRVHLDARAVSAVSTIAVDAARFRDAMHANESLDRAIAHRLLRVVYDRLERARMQLLDMYGGPS
jgi:CRP-like cAMP-binding protein